MVVHAVAAGQAPAALVALLYEVADDRDLPDAARGEDGRMAWRMRTRHRLREPETAVDRAGDEAIVALLRACRSVRATLRNLALSVHRLTGAANIAAHPPPCARRQETTRRPRPHLTTFAEALGPWW